MSFLSTLLIGMLGLGIAAIILYLQGWNNSDKRPFFFDGDTGAVGTYVGTERTGAKQGHVHVLYYPLGSLGIGAPARIPDVPEAAVPGVQLSTKVSPGVQTSGYVFLSKGTRGESSLLDEHGLFLDKRIREVQAAVTEERMSSELERHRAKVAKRGAQQQVKEVAETAKMLKAERTHRLFGRGEEEEE